LTRGVGLPEKPSTCYSGGDTRYRDGVNMPRFLLLGAGFSKNWGGWLASEVADDLIWRLRDNPLVLDILTHAGFEEAYFELRSRFDHDNRVLEDLLALEHAIRQTFGAMNLAFAQLGSLNFSQFADFSVIDFLSRFDAIFTLNQDLLLELHYSGVELVNRRRWNGIQWPGLVPPAGAWPAGTPQRMRELIDQRWLTAAGGDPAIAQNLQPVIKLHGSSTWYAGEGHDRAPLLVIGGKKREAIEANPLLSFYSRYFRECLLQDEALLMTIGYSFGDDHINDVICEAQDAGANFGLFVVDPSGKRVLDKRDSRAAIQDHPGPLMRVRYVGGSSRALTSTFSNDHLEHAKLFRFFDE
jgi:hypothetical protein